MKPTDSNAAQEAGSAPAPAPGPSPVRAARALLKELEQSFEVFRNAMPLAIGIDKQVIAQRPQIDRKLLRIALGLHTNSIRYLKTMEKATHRFDLEGRQGAEVTDAHRAHAAETLKERLKKDAERRRAQRKTEEEERRKAEAEQRRADKLAQLAAKFSRR